MMSLLGDILSWATAELKPWQRDALRRLCEKQDLDPQDFDDLKIIKMKNTKFELPWIGMRDRLESDLLIFTKESYPHWCVSRKTFIGGTVS